jgi:hypothetical protein
LRLIFAKNRDRIGAAQAFDGLLNCAQQIARIQMIDQVRNDFRIPLAFEHKSSRLQLAADLLVIFNDAVVNDTRPQTGAIRTRLNHAHIWSSYGADGNENFALMYLIL